ncbi:MAG: hypothetical protein K0Q49_1612 [Haloplasmataceae bacterium]|jgi:hypothetical protein|nr:hypothetical protein [Haloplasmataceae bacterium]
MVLNYYASLVENTRVDCKVVYDDGEINEEDDEWENHNTNKRELKLYRVVTPETMSYVK